MKKVLSLLLAVVLLCGIAAPLAFATGSINGIATEETEVEIAGAQVNVYSEGASLGNPVALKVNTLALLVLTGAVAGKTYDWQILDGNSYIFSPRVMGKNAEGQIVMIKENQPTNLLRSTGEQMLLIEGAAVGTVTIKVRELELDEVTGNVLSEAPFAEVTLNIQKKEGSTIIGDQNDLWTILKVYWTDLQLFWYNDVHPTFKAVYFAIGNWFAQLGNTIKGWFTGETV